MKCQSCGSDDQAGAYCSACGAPLRALCEACGAELPPGSRFCTQCGEAVKGRGAGGGAGRLPWLVAGAAVILAVLVLLLPRDTERVGPPAMTDPGANAVTGPGSGAGAPVGSPPALSGDMRENADRLYNRIMSARQRGDAGEAERFMPMAVQAYGMVPDLDADGAYHLALLHLAAGDAAAASEAAARILAEAPNHILGLGAAGAAAAAAGDSARAEALYRRLLEAYPAEAARALPEYADHQGMLPVYRRAAREYLGEAPD